MPLNVTDSILDSVLVFEELQDLRNSALIVFFIFLVFSELVFGRTSPFCVGTRE